MVETLLLCVGVIYGVVFIMRTWAFPAAELSLTEQKFIGQKNGALEGTVLLQAKFNLRERSNFDVLKMESKCNVISNGAMCEISCPVANELLTRGTLSGGDSFTWSCMVQNAPINSCIIVELEVSGSAPFPAWGESRWWSTHISCPSG